MKQWSTGGAAVGPEQAALRYLALGWSVVPAHSIDADGICTCTRIDCQAPGKHPRVQWMQYQAERPTEAQVRQWWRRWPEANVAVITGPISGIAVLDIDPRHGGDVSLDSLRPLPPTVTCLTGGGGEHYYYAYPDTGVRNGAGLMHGIDIRGEGGYVIAPPSMHASGRPYLWEVGYEPGEHGLAPLPGQVTVLLEGYRPGIGDEEQPSELDLMAYLAGKLRIPMGERNTTMTRIAGHLLGSGMEPAAALTSMQGVNLTACEPPLEFDEIQKILRSIHSKEQRKRDAQRKLDEQISIERIAVMSNSDRLELARALWEQLGVPGVVDWVMLTGGDELEYRLELADRDVSLGSSILSAQVKIRDILASKGYLVPRHKPDEWDRVAVQLARLARETQVGHVRQSDEVAEWLTEYRQLAQDYPPEMRRDALRGNPIFYNGHLATKTRRFLSWLEATYGVRFTPQQLGKKLRMSGWEYKPIAAGGTTVAVWLSPPLEGGAA